MMSRVARRLAGPALMGLALLVAGCENSSNPELHRFAGPIFGTGFHVTVAADLDADEVASLKQASLEALDKVDWQMSTYKDASELSKLNQAPLDTPITLSDGLAQVLAESQDIGKRSDGAFDITVGPAVNLWGFGPDERLDKAPSDEQIARALEKVDHLALELDGNTVIKRKPVYADLSGIAKGYGVDRVADVLEANGIENYLVEVGGEIRVKGEKPGHKPWRIAIEAPKSFERSVQRIIDPGNAAVATSGDYRNYFEQDGVRYSHTIDPRTGRPIQHSLASVTVITPDCASADAWATALNVLGAEKAMTIADRENIAAYFIVKTDDGFKQSWSPAFAPYLKDAPATGDTKPADEAGA
ncbi:MULTISPECIES: FAD:protein FMN transferase [Cobetia]|uniref:FAD:protein FMN transferase n=1 Tax=Cobetia TaxID=204286 RepID=UPI001FD35E71|nr:MULTISPECIES: FAD:protein FMN transferase [Cobetia]MDH2293010.1 FAD:protein FMN transferase [Cobetia sp. 1AS1]